VNKSPVVKRSIVVGGHKTSVSIEEAFWIGMKEISGQRSMTLSELVGEIDTNRHQGDLSSAIRLFVLDHFRNCSSGFDRRVPGHTSHGQPTWQKRRAK
jgi:predicted DNA-binding ribbon-helix-helix protein